MSILRRISKFHKLRMLGAAGLIVASRVAGSFLTLFYTVLLTIVAPPEEVGMAFAALSAGFALSVLASLNVESGSIRFLPFYIEKKRAADAAGFVLYCRYVTLAVCAVLGVVGFAILLASREIGTLGPYLFSIAAAPVVANARINSRHATALGLVLRGALPNILIRPVLFSVVLLICVATDTSFNATDIMAVFFFASCLTAGAQWALIRNATAFRKNVRPRFSDAKDWTSLGVLLAPMLLINEYMRDLIVLPASAVLPPEDIARLGIALSLIGVLSFAVTAVDMIFSPKISRAIVQEKPRECARLLSICGAAKLGGLICGTPLVYFLIPSVLNLMGNEYEEVEGAFAILVVIPFAKALFGPAHLILNVMGRRWELFWATLSSGLLLVVAIAIGGHVAGLQGAIAGAVSTLTLYYAALFSICRFFHGIDPTILAITSR